MAHIVMPTPHQCSWPPLTRGCRLRLLKFFAGEDKNFYLHDPEKFPCVFLSQVQLKKLWESDKIFKCWIQVWKPDIIFSSQTDAPMFLIPKTTLGKWSVGLIEAMPVSSHW